MNFPLIDAAEFFLNLKQAAEEILPAVEEHADEGGLLQALSEAAKSKLGLAIAYRVYSESLRDPSNSAIGEHFKEHSEDCLNDVDFFVRRSSVMSGGASLEGVESPPPSGDLTEILQVLSTMEEANLQLMSELVVLLEGNPSKYEVEAMMAKDQHHLDDLTQHMPAAPELPSVEEAAPLAAAAPPGVIGPAKVAGVSAKSGLSRVGELLSGSRVKKLEGLSDKLLSGKPLGDRAVVVNVRRLTRAQKGVEAERNSVRTARAITAVGATGVGAAGAHKLLSKKDGGKEKTSEMGAAAMGQHSPVAPLAPLNGAAAGQHPKLAQRTYDMGGSKRDGKAYSMHTTPDDYELSQLINSKMDGDLRGVRGKAKNEGMLVGSGLGAVKGLKAGKGWGGGEVIRTGGGGGTVIGTFGSGGKMPKGMGADIRENQGMIRDELRGQGIKIGYRWDNESDESVARYADHGSNGLRYWTPIAGGVTGALMGRTPAGRVVGAVAGAGLGHLIGSSENSKLRNMARAEEIQRHQHRLARAGQSAEGIKIGGLAQAAQAGAGRLAGAAPHIGSALQWAAHGAAPTALAAGAAGAIGGAVAGGEGHRLSGALKGGVGAGIVGGAAGGLAGAGAHRFATRALGAAAPKLGADKSDSALAETGRQRAVANLASGFTSDKHTSGERHGTLAGRIGGAAVGAGAGALASKGATLPVRLAAGMGGAVIGGSMGGQIGKTIGSDHDAEKFWENHKEAAGVSSSAAKWLAAHPGAVGSVAGGAIGAAGGAIAGGPENRLSGALSGGLVGGVAGGAIGAGGHRLLTKPTAAAAAAPAEAAVAAAAKPANSVVGAGKRTLERKAQRLSEELAVPKADPFPSVRKATTTPAAPVRAAWDPSASPKWTTTSAGKAPAAVAAPAYGQGSGWKSAPSPSPELISAGKPPGKVIGRTPTGTVSAGPLADTAGAGQTVIPAGAASTVIPGSGPRTVSPRSDSNLTMRGGQEMAENYAKQPKFVRDMVEEHDLVRGVGTPNNIAIQPHNALALQQMKGTWGPKFKGNLQPQAATKVAAEMAHLSYFKEKGTIVSGSSEMSPVLGKRVMRNAKQVWDKTVKEAMGEEAPVEQYLQEEAAGRQAQEAAESDYLREQLQQTSQQLEQTQAQAQEQEAQVGEMQGTIQQLQGQQAEQAQAADAAVQTARQTAEAAMSQSMQRSAELMKQTQLAAGLQNAAATMKEQLMALSQTPVPPATVGEAGELDAAAQQQVGQDQAMEEQAAMEEEAQMAAAQGAPPAAAPAAPAPPKTAGMISGAGKVLRNAPGGVVGGVVGAASAAGLGALLRNKETAFLTDAVKKLEAKQQGGFLTGMMLAEARMVADRSAVMDQHPGKAALLNAVRGAGAGFALDKTIRHIS